MTEIEKTNRPIAPISSKPAPPEERPSTEPSASETSERHAMEAEDYERLLDMYDVSFKNFAEGEVVRGIVLKVTDSEVIVDVGYKSEGVIAVDEFKDETGKITIKPGDTVEVLLEKTEDKEGYIVLSK